MTNPIPLILLCAGKSERFGSPKGLAHFGRGSWLRHQIKAFSNFENAPVFMVVGYHASDYYKEVENILEETGDDLNIEVFENSRYERGPFSSLHIAVSNVLKGGYTSAFILPVDVPFPQQSTLKTMAKLGETTDVVVPAYKGQGGHPVLVSRDFLEAIKLADPQKDRLDHMIREWPEHRYAKVEVDDLRVILSFNTPKEFEDLSKTLADHS
jgi:CTP:molybdopterin cytidylyltransferase MocA